MNINISLIIFILYANLSLSQENSLFYINRAYSIIQYYLSGDDYTVSITSNHNLKRIKEELNKKLKEFDLHTGSVMWPSQPVMTTKGVTRLDEVHISGDDSTFSDCFNHIFKQLNEQNTAIKLPYGIKKSNIYFPTKT